MKKLTLILALLLISSVVFAQEKINIKALNIGAKIGFPNIIGGNIEYVTPLLSQRVAVFMDYGSVPSYEIEDAELGMKHTEFGINYYFRKNRGKGLYVGISSSKLKIDGAYSDIGVISEGGIDYDYNGGATGDLEIKTTNLKLGLKIGGTVYFRLEVGYGFGDIPKGIEVTGDATYTDNSGTTTQETVTNFYSIDEIEGLNKYIKEDGLPVINIGIGFAF